METEREILKLLKKYSEGKCTAIEQDIVRAWYDSLDYKNDLTIEEFERAKNQVWTNIEPDKRYFTTMFRYAALFITITSVTTLFFLLNKGLSPFKLPAERIMRTSQNKAMLIINQNDSLDLFNLPINGIIELKNVKIRKLTDGTVSYEFKKSNEISNSYNKLVVPRGSQYKIVLEDGTAVSLNSESVLEFPSRFGHLNRHVKLNGEAYFEVTKNKSQPFIVESKIHYVTVLGTKFNIKAYPNEKNIVTTLIEGKIKINTPRDNVLLNPGDQSTFDGNNLQISKTKNYTDILWTEPFFNFESERLEDIMYMISRWYNFEIVFESEDLKNILFTGSVSKHQSLYNVLQALEMTGKAKFVIEDNRIYVKKNN